MTPILAITIAAVILVLVSPPRWREAAAWGGLGLAGYAASLSLIEAGPFVRYQHYLPMSEWGRAPVAAAIVAAECLLVLAGLWRARGQILDLLPERWRGWRAILLLGLVIVTSIAPSRDPGQFLAELALAGSLALTHLGAAVLVALAVPQDSSARIGRRALDLLDGPAGGRLVAWCAFGTTIAAALLAWFVYERHPHIPDEIVYLLHARYFAAGQLWLTPPVPPEAFDIDLMFLSGGRWYSPVPPGWPAMLAVGVVLGAPWLVNPVLAGLNVLLTARTLGTIAGRRIGRLTAILLAVSPWHLFLGMSFLTHTFTLTCTLLAALAVARARESARLHWMVAGGALTGVVSLIRPLEGLAVAITLGLWSLHGTNLARRLVGGISYSVGAILTGAITLPYNALLTGSATRFPIMAYTDAVYGPGTNAMGFGPNRGLGWSGLDPFPGHGLRDVVVNSYLNTFAANIELLGWAAGSLLVCWAWVLNARLDRKDWALLLPIVVVTGLHTAYWYSGGPDFGARYWFLIIVPVIGLTARGLLATASPEPSALGRVALISTVFTVGALIAFVPWRAADKYYHYRGMRPDIRVLARQHDFGVSLVLVRGKRHPDYHSAAIYNPLDLSAPQPIYAWDRDSTTRAEVLRAYSGRPVWLVDGPSLTGDGYVVIAGPLQQTGVP